MRRDRGLASTIEVLEPHNLLDGLAGDPGTDSRRSARSPHVALIVTAVGKSKVLSYKGGTEVIDDRSTVLWVLREIARRYADAQQAQVNAANSPGRVVLKFVPEKLTNAFDAGLARGDRA